MNLNCTKKIGWIFIVIFGAFAATAQNESPQLLFSDPVHINPAFAGTDQHATIVSGNQYYHIDSTQSYNLLYFSYNTYSDEMNGGLGIFFRQGNIGAQNTSISEIGFAYSSPARKTKNGNIRFGIGSNFLLANKQWFASTLDQIFIEQNTSTNASGGEFMRYILLKPRFSFLWNTRTFRWGLTAGIPIKMKLASTGNNEAVFPLNGTLYLARIKEGYKNGLRSKPFVFSPELLVFYQQDYFIGRIRARIEHSNHSLGAFMQNDFTNNLHILGGTLGVTHDNFKIELNAGAGIPGISDEIGFCGEVSLQLSVPRIDYTQINPWAPQKR